MGQAKGTEMKMPGKAAVALIVCAVIAWWVVDRARAQATGVTAGKRSVLFLANDSLPPLNFLRQGEPTGLVVDLGHALAKRMHRPVEIRLMNWAEAQQLVLSGTADALLQINSSPERIEIYDFSEPLLTSDFSIFTSGERPGIHSFYDLHGLKVGVETRGLPALLLQRDPRIILINIPDFVQGFRMLTAGDLDAVVADRRVGSYVLAENNIRGVRLAEEPISRIDSAIAVKKGNTALLEEINAALADIRRDGTYDRIIKSWQSKEVVFKTLEQLRRERLLSTAISAALILALISLLVMVREIRRRKHLEEILRNSEERFRLALRNAPVSVAMQDRDLMYIWAYNQRTARPDEIVGKLDTEIFTSEEAERLTAIKRRVLDENVEIREQMWLDRPGGRIFLDVYFKPINDKTGQVTGVGIATLDLTPIKLAEQALRESEARFRTLVTGPGPIVFRAAGDGSILDGPGWEVVTGQLRESYQGSGWLERVHPEDLAPMTAHWSACLSSGEPAQSDYRILTRDGHWRWVHGYGVPVRGDDGSIIEWVGTITDIHERYVAQEALRESEERLRLLGDNLPESAVYQYAHETDGSVRFLYFSAGIERLNGVKVEEVLRDPGMLHRQILPEYFERLATAELESAREMSDFDMEVPMRLNDGQIRWMRLHSRPRRMPGGRIIWDGVQIDVTERRLAEAALHQSEAKYRRLFENIQEMVTVYEVERDERGQITEHWLRDGNPAFLRAAGVASLDEIRGKTSSRVFGKAWSENHLPAVRHAMDSGEVRVQEVYRPESDHYYITTIVPLDANTYLGTARDITERKQAEETLRRTVQRFHNILSNIFSGILVLSENGRIEFVNPIFCDQFNIAENPSDLIGMTASEMLRKILPAYANSSESLARIREILSIKKRVLDEEVLMHDGRVLLRDYIPILLDGESSGRMWQHRDITERKRMEEKLRQSEARYRMLHESLRDPFVQVSMDGRIIEFNDLYREILGYSPEEMRELTYQELTPERWHAFEEAIVREQIIARGYSDVYEKEYRRKDGTIFPVELRTVLSRDASGQPNAMWGIVRDITERKMAEEELKNTREEAIQSAIELDSTINSIADGVLIYDCEGNLIRINAMARHLLGYTSDRLTLPVRERIDNLAIRYLDGRDVPYEDLTLIRALRGETVIGQQLLLTPPKRNTLCLSFSAAPIKTPSGDLIGYITTFTDLTKLRDLNVELQKAKEELESSVLERTAELRVSNKALMEYATKLERLNQELEEFAFVASHDLQEPLRKIQTFGSMLLKDHKENMALQAQEYLLRITGSAKRMSDSIHSLLNYTRITSEPPCFESVDLATIAGDAAIDLEIAINQAGGRVEIGSLPMVEADAVQIRHLFQNLIENSIKYHKAGECPLVKIHGETGGGICSIFVEDNGIGFDEQFLDLIFKPFQQLHRRGKYEGIGMGLALCRKIVERHQGSITARSMLGQGSTFIVRLPSVQSETK